MRLRTALALLLACALLWWFVRGTDLRDIAAALRDADGGLLALGLVCMGFTYVARALRWQQLLAPIGPTRFRTAFRTTVIGFAALGLLPVRVGDFLRPYLLAQQEGLSPTATFATIVMERVLDLLAVLALLAIYVWGSARWSSQAADVTAELRVITVAGSAFAGLMLAALGAMWVLATRPERAGAVVHAAARVLPLGMAERLGQMARAFSGGFAAARSPRVLGLATAWSFPVWLASAAEVWAVSLAFGLDLPLPGAFLIQTLLVIGVAVPIPGGVGSFHAAYRYGMTTFFGAAEHQTVAAALVLHAISFLPVVLLGAIFMAQDGLSVGRLRQLADEARDKELPHTDEVPILRSSRR
jgi:hypothetical protein